MDLSPFNHGRKYAAQFFHSQRTWSICEGPRAFEACQSRHWGECHLVGYSHRHYHWCQKQIQIRTRWTAHHRRRVSLSLRAEEQPVAVGSGGRQLLPFETSRALSRSLSRWGSESVVRMQGRLVEPETLLWRVVDWAQKADCHIHE